MSLSLLLPLLAQGEAPAAAPAPAAPTPVGGMGSLGSFLPFLLIIAIFYFLMIRPQQRKEKERRKQIEELRAGARILFAGGIIGTIVEAREATFLVEVANGVNVEIARGAVIRPLKEGETASVDEAR